MPTMAGTKHFLLLFFITSSLCFSSFALAPSTTQSCANYVFPNNREFASCVDLLVLNSFLHWTYYPSSSTVQIAYRYTGITSTTWVAWGINPTSKGMVGTQALITYQKSDGTIDVYTSPVNSYKTQLLEGNLSFKVSYLSAMVVNQEIIIFATLELSKNTSTINYVWQDGPVLGNVLGMHSLSGQHLQSMGTLDLSSGISMPTKGGNSKAKLRNVHGVLNVVSWGTMMPIGILLARYLNPSNSLGFYIHVTCQFLAFIIGVVGWATGIALRLKYSGVHHTDHMAIGTIVFCLAIPQVASLWLRPKRDHKYRSYWNTYHKFLGYIVVDLGISNVFIGYKILNPAKGWEIAYYVIFGALLFALVVLEAWKRYVEKKPTSEEKMAQPSNEANEVVANAANPQESV